MVSGFLFPLFKCSKGGILKDRLAALVLIGAESGSQYMLGWQSCSLVIQTHFCLLEADAGGDSGGLPG